MCGKYRKRARSNVEYQADYLRRYWRYFNAAVSKGTTDDKIKALNSAKRTAKDEATAAMLNKLKVTWKPDFSSFKKDYDEDGSGRLNAGGAGGGP